MHHQQNIPIGANAFAEEYVHGIRDQNLPPLLSPLRVAALLDLDRRRVYELVQTGDLAAVRTGRRNLRIYRDSLIHWLERGGTA